MILLDMDGVLVDFVGASISLHNRNKRLSLSQWPAGEYDVENVIGCTRDEFWRRIDDAGESWWATLPAYPWADNLIELVSAVDPEFHIATSPSRFHGSASGKVLWLQSKFGESWRRYMLGPNKSLLARPGSVLIDDSEAQIDAFNEAGGTGILFPAPWNRLASYLDAMANPVRYIARKLFQQ